MSLAGGTATPVLDDNNRGTSVTFDQDRDSYGTSYDLIKVNKTTNGTRVDPGFQQFSVPHTDNGGSDFLAGIGYPVAPV